MTRRAGETGNKVRRQGIELALARGFAAAGGVAEVERVSGIKEKRLYAAQDPAASGKQKELTAAELFRLARILPEVAKALAEHFAEEGGGAFLDLNADGGEHSTGWWLSAVGRHYAELSGALNDGDMDSARQAARALLSAAASLCGALLRKVGGGKQ